MPTIKCCVAQCFRRSKPGVKRSFYAIPKPKKNGRVEENNLIAKRKDAWVLAIGQEALNKIFSGNYFVCSDHFHGGNLDIYM